ncbi:hypothetical protein WJX77_010775 [Trebouxia sp. C0004]
MSYTPLVSSFEMNEHLASVDHSMPLFPRSNRITTPLRQLNLQAGNSTPLVTASLASLADPLFQHQSAHSTTPQPAALSGADQPELSLALAFDHLVQLIDREDSSTSSLFEKLSQDGQLSPASLQKFLQEVLGSMVPAAPTSFMAALIAGETCDSLTWSQLAQAAKGTASVIKDFAQASAQDPASHLVRLALVFTQRQLDVQKAFADLDEQRNGSITPAQLVSVLKHMDPSVAVKEVQTFLWRLYCVCHPYACIHMQDIKAVLHWAMQADAYPGKDFAPKTRIKHAQHGSVAGATIWMCKTPPVASAALDRAPSRQPAALETIPVGVSAPVLQPFLVGAAQDADARVSIVEVASAQPGNPPPMEATCAEAVAQHRQESGQLEMSGAQSEHAQRQANGHDPGEIGERFAEQAEGQTRGQAEGQSKGQTAWQAQEQPRGPEGLSSNAVGQQQATEILTGNALQQLILRAQKLKQQLDAHAERKASRLPTSRSAPAVPNWAQFAPVGSAPSAPQIPNQVLPISGRFASPFALPVPLAFPLQTSAASLFAYPSALLNAGDHAAPASAATSQPNLRLPQNSDTQLAQPSQPPPSLPLYTADTYGFMKRSLGQNFGWPQVPLTAVISSSLGSRAAHPLSEAGQPAAASHAPQSWQCGRPGGVDSMSDDGSSVESDPAAVVEDALLGELFFQQLQVQQQDSNRGLVKLEGDTADVASPAANQTEPTEAHQQLECVKDAEHDDLFQAQRSTSHVSQDAQSKQVQAAEANGTPVTSEGYVQATVQKVDMHANTQDRWSITLKAMCKGHADVAMLQHRTSQQVEEQLPAVASVAAPACLVSAAQLHQELSLVLEVWYNDGAEIETGPKLAGIVTVPLDLTPLTAAALETPTLLAKGHFHIWDVFQSKAVGTVTLTAAYQAAADSKEAAQPAAEAAHDEEEQAVLCKLTELAQTEDAASCVTGASNEGDMQLDPPPPVDAVMCVQIIRACGLLAAVNEASIWLGGGSSLLGRAKQLGPHSFVHLSLFPGNEQLEVALPPVQTPFQAQTFCPEFHFRRQLPLQIDARMVRDLATQELVLEVWHHCPRSQAVAAALSQGGSTSQSHLKYRDVFLGSGFAPLHALLNKPQGLNTWVGLKSRRGEPVGAVQIKVSLTQLKGQHQQDCRSVFAAMPELATLLPPEASPQARPFSLGGIEGQQARCTVYIEDIMLSQAEDGVQARPKSAMYYSSYRLPGSANLERSASKAATALAAANRPSGAFKVALGHCGIHWVTADASLAHALQVHPLVLTVYKQGSIVNSCSSGRTAVTTAAAPVPIGSAEVDLSPLLATRAQGKEDDSRWLSGTYLLVHPASKHLGHARVRVKVLLELKPHGSGRANARHWQVPQVVPTVIQTDSSKPVEAGLVGLTPEDGAPFRVSPAQAAPEEVHAQPVIASTQPGQAALGIAAVQAVGGNSRGGSQKVDAELGSPVTFKADAVSSPSAMPFAGGVQFASAGNSPSPSREDTQTGACLSAERPAANKLQPVTEGVRQTSAEDTSLEVNPGDTTNKQIPSVRLCIEQALHLALSPAATQANQAVHTAAAGQALSGNGSAGLARVEYLWQGVGNTTPAVGISAAGSAMWQYMVDLPEAGPGVSRDTGLSEGGSCKKDLLDLQVFLQHAQGECESIGTAQVELSLLHVMGHVSGWYNIINARGNTCGQLKISVTAPGQGPQLVHAHNPGNTTCYLDSASSHLPSSPVARLGRLRADITSVAAPVRAALALSESIVGSSWQSLEGFTGAEGAEGIPGPLQDVDPRAVLRTQMQQLNQLSQMMSQRLHVSHHESAAADDADDHLTDEPATASMHTRLVSSDDQSRSHKKDADRQGASNTATHTDMAEEEERVSQHAGQPESAGHLQAGLQWGALSDEEEEVVAAAMDGYTSSNNSYGGHTGGFAFEGAISEADPYETQCAREEDKVEPKPKTPRHTLSSFMDDDWMFGCQKDEDVAQQPAAPPGHPSLDKLPHHTGREATQLDRQGSTPDGQVDRADRQVDWACGQAANADRQLEPPSGNVAMVQEGNTASSQTWTMSVPAQVLQSNISFANALPPIPMVQQLRPQSPESADDANQADNRVQQLDTSVADWLSHQVSAELLTDGLGSGHSLAELATAGQEQGQAAAVSVHQSDADAIPSPDQRQEVTRAFQNLNGVGTLVDSQGFAPDRSQQTSAPRQMPGMHDDWMFDITRTSRTALNRDDQQQQAAPQDSHAAGRQQPAASQELQALTQVPAVSEVPASVKEAVDRFESWTTAQQSLLLPTGERPAAAVQSDEQTAPGMHSQQHPEGGVRQFQQEQQTLVQQEVPELCPSQTLLQRQQHRQQLTGHQDAGQQHHSLSQLASQQQLQAQGPGLPQQQHSVRHQEQQQYKTPIPEYPGADSSLQESVAMLQAESVCYRGSSHALGMIDATLAAINGTQTGPATAAPPAQIQSPAAASAGASHTSDLVTKPAASVSSHRPLHGHTSGLTLSTRPGFTDAFANPSLYQQPWLRPATKSDAANASLLGFGSDHEHSDPSDPSQKHSLALRSTAAVGFFTAEAADRPGHTDQGLDWSSSHRATCSAPTDARPSSTAQAGGVQHAPKELGHSSTAQKGDQQVTSAPVATISTSFCETISHVPEETGLTAAQAAYQEAKAASGGRKSAHLSASRSGGSGGDEVCTAHSRWSAVNAYRQAREAAERAAEGASSGSGMLAQPLHLGSSSHLLTADASRTARLSDRLAYSHDVQGQTMPPQSRPSAPRPRGVNWRAWLLPDDAQPDISQTASASQDTYYHAHNAQPEVTQHTGQQRNAAASNAVGGRHLWEAAESELAQHNSHGMTAGHMPQLARPMHAASHTSETDRITRIMLARD